MWSLGITVLARLQRVTFLTKPEKQKTHWTEKKRKITLIVEKNRKPQTKLQKTRKPRKTPKPKNRSFK